MPAATEAERARFAAPLGDAEGPLLIIMPSWVGDIVMATPALRAFAARAERDGRRVEAIVRPGAAPLLAGLGLSATIELDLRGVGGLLRGARALRARRAGAALLLPNSFRAALAVALARVPCRMGYATDGRGMLLHRRIRRAKPRDPISAVDWYADLAAALLDTTVDDRSPRLVVTDAERSAADGLLADTGRAGSARSFVLMNPGANRTDKRWPAARFAAFGVRFAQRHGLGIVVTGSPKERVLTAEVAAACPGAIDLAARGVDLAALKGVIADAALLVSNDTGPRHIAIALGTPVVSLFGPTDHRWTTVVGAVERRLVAEPFLPAEESADRHAAHCAIDRISVGDALHAAEALLASPLPRRGVRGLGI